MSGTLFISNFSLHLSLILNIPRPIFLLYTSRVVARRLRALCRQTLHAHPLVYLRVKRL